MFRVAIESLFTILLILVARAVITSLMKGVANASKGYQQPNPATNTPPPNQNQTGTGQGQAGELHKDPVCGTYVAESTKFRQQVGAQIFYYCSDACREKHALVAR